VVWSFVAASDFVLGLRDVLFSFVLEL
jgi:hypothetical protein